MKKIQTVEQRAGGIADGRIKVLQESPLVSDRFLVGLLEKAKKIVIDGGVLPIFAGGYEVRSSDGGAYTVGSGGCSCDFYSKKISAKRCKHIIATEIYKAGADALVEDYRAEAKRLIEEAEGITA